MTTTTGSASSLDGTGRKVFWRIMPFMFLAILIANIDRANVNFAALQMNQQFGFTPVIYALGVGMFSIGYFLFEVPSNLLLERFGARRWIARIMITWGIIACAMAFIFNVWSFYGLRFLLGLGEAGLVPGAYLYFSYWFGDEYRAKSVAIFNLSAAFATIIGGSLSAVLLGMGSLGAFQGWQWLYIIEGVPAIVLGFICLFVLQDRPSEAKWLSADEKRWLAQRVAAERKPHERGTILDNLKTLGSWRVLMLSLVNFFFLCGFWGLGAWLPQIIKAFGYDNGTSSLLAIIPSAFAIVGTLLWAASSDRTRERTWHAGVAIVLAAVALAVSTAFTSAPFALAAVTVGMISLYSFGAIMYPLCPKIMHKEERVAGVAMVVAVGNLGGIVGPFIMGWLQQVTGSFTSGLFAFSGFLILAGILFVVVQRASEREVRVEMAAASA